MADIRFRELTINPPIGASDRRLLQTIHQYLFQDNPASRKSDAVPFPGAFRTGQRLPRLKSHQVKWGETAPEFVSSLSVYAPSIDGLDEVLARAQPSDFANMSMVEFAVALGRFYSAVDYLHPFYDGNGRTLAIYTQHLANQAGYDLNWRELIKSPANREALTIARDKGARERAELVPTTHDAGWTVSERLVTHQKRFEDRSGLAELFITSRTLRPSCAVAFEKAHTDYDIAQAVAQYPALRPFYDKLGTDLRETLQARLDTGDGPQDTPTRLAANVKALRMSPRSVFLSHAALERLALSRIQVLDATKGQSRIEQVIALSKFDHDAETVPSGFTMIGLAVDPLSRSEYRVMQVEKAADTYLAAKEGLWASGEMPAVRREIEARSRQTGLSVENVTEKMTPDGEMADLHETFRQAVSDSLDAQRYQSAMNKAFDAWARKFGRNQGEQLTPTLQERLDSTRAQMQTTVSDTPRFEGESRSHMEKLNDFVNQIAREKTVEADDSPRPHL